MGDFNINKYKIPKSKDEDKNVFDINKYKTSKSEKKSDEYSIAKQLTKETSPLDYLGFKIARNVGAAAATGLQNTGNNLADLIHAVMERGHFPAAERFKEQPGQRADFYKMLGVKEKPAYTPTGALQTIAQYAGPSELGIAGSTLLNAGRIVPASLSATKYLGKALGKHWGNSLSNMLNRGIAGALTDMLGSEKPTAESETKSGIISALLPHTIDLLLKGGSKGITAIKNMPEAIKNYILNQTEKSSERGSANTPEQAAENLKQNFMNVKDERMPVDFGKVTNMPGAETAYNVASKVPFSGGSETENIIRNQAGDVAVKRAEDALKDSEKYASEIRGESVADIASHGYNLEKMENDYKQANTDHEIISSNVEQAPKVINSLIDELPKDTSLPEYISKETKRAFDNLRAESTKSYEKLKSSDVAFHENIPGEAKFPTFNEQRLAFEEQRDKLIGMFVNHSDMPGAITKELNVAKHLIENEGDVPITLNELRQHTSTLGGLWQKAKSAGADNAARMIMNMRSALVNDTKDLLEHTGYKDELALWNDADAKWRQSAQFFNTPAMRKVVGKKTTEKGWVAEGDKLAKELHSVNNADILNMLPNDARKAASHLLITQGKGLTAATKMSPEQIAKRAESLTPEQFNIIKSHDPKVGEYIESLSQKIENQKNLAMTKKQLAKNIDKVKFPKGQRLSQAVGDVDKRLEQLNKAKAERFSSNNVSSSGGNTLANAITKLGLGGTAATTIIAPALAAKLLGAGGVALGAGSIASRSLRKILLDPELLNKYMARERYPLKQPVELPSLTKAVDKYLSRNK